MAAHFLTSARYYLMKFISVAEAHRREPREIVSIFRAPRGDWKTSAACLSAPNSTMKIAFAKKSSIFMIINCVSLLGRFLNRRKAGAGRFFLLEIERDLMLQHFHTCGAV
jgi:hypothetical protein